MRRLFELVTTSLLLAGVLAGPATGGVSAATASLAGFACDPHGTTSGSPTTTLSAVSLDTTAPSNAQLTCLFRGTVLPFSLGGTCHVALPGWIVDFRTRILLPVNGNAILFCRDAVLLSASTDLSVTKTDGASTAIPGTNTTYTITITNLGPLPVSGATVTDAIPAAITTASYTSVAAGGASGNTAAGSGSIADTVNLPVGASITYTVTAHIDASATGSLANTTTVALPVGLTDPVPGNNSATDTDDLTPQADISVNVNDDITTIPAGGTTTWTVTITNNGPSTAHLTAGKATFGTHNCILSLQVNGWPAVTLAPGATQVSTVVSGTATGQGDFADVAIFASASASELDPNPANNQGSDTDACTPAT